MLVVECTVVDSEMKAISRVDGSRVFVWERVVEGGRWEMGGIREGMGRKSAWAEGRSLQWMFECRDRFLRGMVIGRGGNTR